MELVTTEIQSPVGLLIAAFSPSGLAKLSFTTDKKGLPVSKAANSRQGNVLREGYAIEAEAALRRQLGEYFEGTRKKFDLQLDLMGPPYWFVIWEKLLGIPYGRTVTYGDIAAKIGGNPRAVGSACAANPVPIIVPCHRVVGADGSLRGFGGGLRIKRFLLQLEGAQAADQMSLL